MASAIRPAMSTRRKNFLLALVLLAILAAMSTLVAFSVPLYRLFCQVTSFGGTTQVAASAAEGIPEGALVEIRFDTNVAPDMPWAFSPPEPVDVQLGEELLVAFEAINESAEPVLGTATFNVTPHKAGAYFNKIECFCFTEQLLMPGESKEFPVMFFVDPAIADDPNTEDVSAITLSYTFFNKGEAALNSYLQSRKAEMTNRAKK
ncbi:MAG: cytochrome c oxidase assembly protein [Alphaproteobacteria bacterium]